MSREIRDNLKNELTFGIYSVNANPRIGGGASLTSTISSELKEFSFFEGLQIHLVILYNGGLLDKKRIYQDNLLFINTKRVRICSLVHCFAIQFLYVLRNIKRRLSLRKPVRARASWMDLLAKKEGIDLYWFTAPLFEHLQTPYIYTVWDLGHREWPEFPEMRLDTYAWNLRELTYQEMLPRASYIITGNEQGERDILENYPLPEKRIHIAPFPVSSFCFGGETKPTCEIPDSFFLYPAQFWAHKNHIRIVRAVEILRNRFGIKANVVFTGTDYINQRYVMDAVKKRNLDDNFCFLGFVDEKQLRWLYTHAVALVFSSLLGPNNLPPIEACYLGCPVILSDIQGHREEIGGAGLYFDGFDDEKLALHMRKLLLEPDERDLLIEKGKTLANQVIDHSYIDVIKGIIEDFSKKLECWKEVL